MRELSESSGAMGGIKLLSAIWELETVWINCLHSFNNQRKEGKILGQDEQPSVVWEVPLKKLHRRPR